MNTEERCLTKREEIENWSMKTDIIEELISFVKFHECHSIVNLFATVRVQENLLWSELPG